MGRLKDSSESFGALTKPLHVLYVFGMSHLLLVTQLAHFLCRELGLCLDTCTIIHTFTSEKWEEL